MKKKIIILGAQGFIGINYLRYADNQNYNLIGVGHKSYNKNILKKYNYQFFKGDIYNYKLYSKYINKESIVLFMGVSNFYFRNLIKFKKLLYFLKRKEIKKIVLISSSSVYGNNKNINDERTKINPINKQGHYFLRMEDLIKSIMLKSDTNYIILRTFNVFGKYRKKLGFIEKLAQAFMKDKKFFFYKNNLIRSYIGAKDLAKIISYVIKKINYNLILNVSNPKYVFNFKKILKFFEIKFKKEISIKFKKVDKNIINSSICYPRKLLKIYNIKFEKNFLSEISQLINFYKKQNNEKYF